jgi:ABC-2 type transport system ATP-binding protein
MPVASAASLTVRYGSKTAVDDLSVEFPEGCVGLLGANGAGKTTLINSLLGFVRPTRGKCSVLGMDSATQPLKIRQRIGLMPERDCHIPGLNAVSFVAYAGELSGMPGAQALRRAHEVLEYCGLGEARYRNVETYSTGMKQRIKLAQALVHGPGLLLLDEPTNGLDPAGRDDMLNLVRDISHGKDIQVIVCSHILPDIERVCDTVVVMRAGKLAMQGAIAELRATQGRQFDVDLRFPTPAFLDAVIRGGGAVVHELGARCRIRLDGAGLDTGRFIFEAARQSGAEVRGFQAAVRSLEDVFLEAVE